jgi:hypothetical protein
VSVDQTEPAENAPTRTLGAGAQLGKYKLTRLLGEGGMGQVWAAHDPDLERSVALKLLRAENAAPQLRTRLLREARAMARLKHPNVLTVYEVGTEGDRDYIAMELVDGMNLDQWLATAPPKHELWTALLAAGHGLAAAHRAGLVHRDFKPHNVLRSRDGRVLVTDFGLARGVGDEPTQAPESMNAPIALDVTLDAGSKDSLLDSPLTQTGALIGTPAYMAPEQYVGTPPDPRTDQFAFCVTVWQALTGKRPFDGSTLDELRRATNRGVAHLQVKLPRGVRAVLARGLDPDPTKRWDDLDDLLAALDRARGARRRRLGLVAPVFAFSAAIAMFVTMHHDEPAKKAESPYACQPPEVAFADAWTNERRNALEKRVGTAAALAANALDDLRAAWLKSYAETCAAPPSQATFARLGCLLGERDDVSAFSRLADTLPRTTFDHLDLYGFLPRVEACASDAPIASPLLPKDRKQRDDIISLRALVASLRLREPQQLVDQAADMAKRARALGWPPLEPEVDHGVGAAALFLGRYDVARTHLTAAAERAAQLRDYRLEAVARIALLETENYETADPTDPDREARLTREARDAVHRAGDDPELADTIDVINATARISRGDYAGAGLLLQRDSWGSAQGTRASIMQAAQRLRLALYRGDFDEAEALGLQHEASQPPGGRAHALIEQLMVQAEWGLGKLEETHTRADKLFQPTTGGPDKIVYLKIKVVDEHGAPVPHARVAGWGGELIGDAHRIYKGGDFTGDAGVTDGAGEWSLMVPLHGTVMAERDDLRSPPTAVIDGKPLTLTLGPVHAISGKVSGKGPMPPRDAFVMISVPGGGSWVEHAPVGSDRSFRIAGVPPGPATIGLAGTLADMGHRVFAGPAHDGATLTWPGTTTVDVITDRTGIVFVEHGHVRPKGKPPNVTISGSSDWASAETMPIGFSSIRAESQKFYVSGDVHAVFPSVTPGETTVCVVGKDDAPCVDVTVPASGVLPVVIRSSKGI